MRRKEKSKNKKETGSKKAILITVFLIIVAISSSFLIYFILQVSLNTTTPIVVVTSPSMSPSINTGDLLFLRGVDPASIQNGTEEDKNGAVILFNAQGLWIGAPTIPVVHRVVNKRNNSGIWEFLTKGDANNYRDGYPAEAWVSEDRIFGVVVGMIPYIGWVKIILTDSGLLIPLIAIVVFLIIASIIWDAYKEQQEKRNALENESSETSEGENLTNGNSNDNKYLLK
jgi:signal peptidase I